MQGPRNPLTNFFSGQITRDDGNLDTSGTHGDRNHTPDAPFDAGRQGWDITNIDVSARLRNNQTSAFAQGTTSGDAYAILALALQIDVGAPRFASDSALTVDRPVAAVGDVLTYTAVLDNSAGTADASNLVFFDEPAPGTSFVPGSFSVNGVIQAGANPVAGVPLGAVAAGTRTTVRFQVRIDAVAATDQRVNRARWTFGFVSCAGQPAQSGAGEATAVTVVPVTDLELSKFLFSPTPAVAGSLVRYRIQVINRGPSAVTGAVVTDAGPTPPLAGLNWVCFAIRTASCPASGTGPINAAVDIAPGGTVLFTLAGTLPASTPVGTLTNTASVAAPGGVPDFNPGNNTATLDVPIARSADLSVAATGPATAQRGTNVTYTITVGNHGASDAGNVVVTSPTPAGLTLVSPISGPCAAAPGCAIAVGATQTLTVTYAIPPEYAGADPIIMTATASDSAASDTRPANNEGRARTALDAPVAALTLTKTNGVDQVTAGLRTTYSITVTNAGPASAIGSHVVDQFDPALFTDVRWQCAASGTSSCTVSGLQTGNIDTLINVNPGAGNAVVLTADVLVLSTLRGTAGTPPGTESSPGIVTNTATVTPPPGVGEADQSDNTATDADAVTVVADMSIVKTGPATIVPGTTVDYTVVVSNAGPSSVRNFVFADSPVEGADINGLPRTELVQSVLAPAGSSCTTTSEFPGFPSLPVCTIPLIEAGGSRVFTVRLAIPETFQVSAGPPVLSNFADALTAGFDSDPDLEDLTSITSASVVLESDVAVTKTGPVAVVAGNQVSYFVDVFNNGPSEATNVTALDVLPAGVTVAGGFGPCVTAFAEGTPCAIGSIAPSAHVTTRIDLLVPVDYAGPPALLNSVTVTGDGVDPVGSNNSASASTLVVPDHADVGVTLSPPASVPVGGTLTVSARVTNFGPGPALNVVLTASIPAGSTVVGRSIPSGVTCTTPTPGVTNLSICQIPVMEVGQSLDFSRTLQIDASIVDGSVLTDLVTVASETTPGHNPDNNQAVTTITVTGGDEAGVFIEKSDSPDPVVVGTGVTYTLTVGNRGPAAATNVTVVDTLPAGMILVSATPSQGTCGGATCNLGTIAASGTATVTILATASIEGVFTNTATVTAAEPDPVLTNNTVSQTTTVATADHADLQIEKVGPTLRQPGQTSFYTTRVTNRGPGRASSVQVNDTLPAGLIFLGNSGACSTPFPCEFDALEPGQSIVIFTAFTVDPALPTPTTVVNAATVSSPVTLDPNPANNISAVTLGIDAVGNGDIVVTKVDSPDAVLAGTSLSYAVSVLNRGPSQATNVVLTDILPAGLTLISATHAGGACAGTTTITCAIGTMNPATVVQVGILATVAPDAPPLIGNTASATSSSPDPDLGDNSRTEPTTVLPPIADLSIAKVLTTPPIPGLPATYQIVVTNNGPSAVAGAAVTDVFPVALGGVAWTCGTPAGSACGAAAGAGAISTTVSLRVGHSATFVATGSIASGALGELVNTATVAVPAGATDPVPANNVASSAATMTPSADVQVTKSGPAQATAGTPVTYSISVTNAGPSDAVDVVLADPVPAGLTFVPGGDPCPAYPCALGAIAAGATVTATAAFAVPPGYTTPDPIVNTATAASASTPDPAAGNNTASAMSAISAPVTDLGIAKSNAVSVVVPGGTTTYTITVTNAGPSNATGATVTDVFPAAITSVTWTCAGAGGGVCGMASGSGNINTTVSLPAGGSVTFMATATISPDAVGVLVNTATVTAGAGQSDPSSANNTDQDSITPQADLAISKIGPASAVVGSPIAYTITVTNNGPSNAENVIVEDPTPTGLVFVSNAGDCATAFPCALGTIPGGASRTITATFTLPAALGVPLPIANVATVSTTTTDPNAANDSASVETGLNRDADIDITTSATPSTGVLVGSTVVLRVGALNRGPNAATGVVVTDLLPAGFTFVSAAPTQGTYDAATGTWSVGDLAVNAAALIDLTVTVTAPGSITNMAVKTGENEPDGITANDSSAVTINAAPAADLALEKTQSVSEPLVGETVTFTVRATNRGPSAATGVTVADPLPAGLTLQAATPSQGSYDPSTGAWTIGGLAPAAEATLTLTTTVDQPGALSNNAVVSSPAQADPNPLNNNDAASINAVPNADLRVAKAVSNVAPAVGSEVTYTVAVTNLGPSAAANADILDVLPADVAFVSATPSQGTYDSATGIWTVGALAVTRTETLSIVGRVTGLGTITNSASRQTSAPVDPNPDNDGASATATASVIADLAIAKTPSATTVVAGGPITWTIVVTNNGPSAAAGAQVVDVFPAAVSVVQWTCTPSSGGLCAAASGTGAVATTADLTPGGTATIVATGTVNPGATGLIDNVATVTLPPGAIDPDPANNAASGPVQVTSAADVAIAGSGPASASPGETVVYTFVVTNPGPSVAVVDFDAATPSGLAPAGVSGACAAVPCALGALAPGASRTIALAYAIPLAYEAPNPIAVTAVVISAEDPNAVNNTATVTTAVTPLADLAIVKSGPATVIAGETVTYTLTITNVGPSNAVGVIVTDPTPAGLEIVSNAGDCTTTFPCALGTLPPGASRTITSRFVVPVGPGAPDIITNSAAVSSSTADPKPVNDASTVQTAVVSVVDVAVAKSVDNPTPNLGDVVTFTVTAANAGPSAATGVVVADTLSAGLRLTGAAPSVGTFDPTSLQWDIGTLLPGSMPTLVVTAEVIATQTQVNGATVVGLNELDTAPGNNTAAAAVNVPAAADLQMAKTVDTTVAPVGATVLFTVSVRNAGPDAADGVQVFDDLAPGLTFVAATPGAGTFDPSTRLWNIGTLPSGATATLQIAAQVNTTGVLPNVAQVVASGAFDPAPANNAAGQVVNGVAADIQVVKTADRPQGVVGDTITFTVVVTNVGPTRVTGVAIEDVLPPGLQLVSATPSLGSYDPTTGLWSIAELGAPGVSSDPAPKAATLEIVAALVAAGAWDNVARVHTSGLPDLNPLNNVGTVTVGVSDEADLAVQKVSDVSAVTVGGTVVFTVTLINDGPSAATNIALVDSLTAGLSLLSAVPSAGTFDSGTRTWTLPGVAAGGSATLSLTALANAAGPQANTVTIAASGQPDPDTSNNTAGAALNVTSADLQLSKTADRDFAALGAAIGFTVRVRNVGPDAATGVVIGDVLPPALELVLATPSAGAYNPASGLWTVGTIAAGAEATLRMVAIVRAVTPTRNVAAVAAVDQADPAPGNNFGEAIINNGAADVAVAQALIGAQPLIGDLVTIRTTVTNHGPGDATGIVLTTSIPPGMHLVVATPSQGTFDPATGRWTAGNVGRPGVGAPATLDLLLRLNSPAQTVASSIASADQLDQNGANNQAAVTLAGNYWSTFLTDLEVDAAVNAPAAIPGTQVTFSVTSFNRGPTWAEDVTTTATLPAGLTFVAATPSLEGICVTPPVGASGAITCHWPGVTVVEQAAQRTFTLIATVDPGLAPGTPLTSHFETASITGEYYPADNVEDVLLNVPGGPVDLAVLASAGGALAPTVEMAVPAGEPVAVRFVVTNVGPTPASGSFQVTSPDASLLQIVGASVTRGTGRAAGSIGIWDLDTLEPGASAEATLIVRLLTAQAVSLVIQRIGGNPADGNRDNDAAQVSLDGTGFDSGGRYTASGNLDGVGGGEIIVGAGFRETPVVRVFTGSGLDTGIRFYAYDRRFAGGVRVAACDVDGDGTDEIVTGAGPGGGPHVRVMRVRGREISEIVGFYAFDRLFPGGVYVGCTDIDRDGRQEVVVSADAGGPPEVRIFAVGPNRFDLVASWLAYEPGYRGGVRVGGIALAPQLPFEVLTTPGPGRAGDVRAWQVRNGAGVMLAQLRADQGASGSTAAIADMNADGSLELVVAASSGPAVVRLFSIANGRQIMQGTVYPSSFLGGVRFSLGLLDGGPGVPEFIAGQGAGGQPLIETYYLAAGSAVRRLSFATLEVP